MGLPFPTEASYVLASVQIRQGQSFWLMLVLLTAGHVAGSMTAYGLGWWGKGWLAERFRHSSRYLLASEAIQQWYDKYGYMTVFALRFVGYLRPWSSLAAGFARIKWQPFLILTLAGSLIFNVIVLEFTLGLVNWWAQFGYIFKIISIGLFLISFSVIFWIGKYWHRQTS